VAECKFRRVLSVCAVLICFSLTTHVFAQDMSLLVRIYADIDAAFASRSSEAVSAVLKTNSTSPSYELVENYALKKTRQLIIRNDLEFAKETSLALIDNNVENYDAIDLYSYIDKALVGEEQKKQAEEEKKLREQARQAALAAKTKQQIETKGSFQTMNTTTGKSVYVNEQNQSYVPLQWTVELGIADIMYQMCTGVPDASKANEADPPKSDTSSTKYGMFVGFDLFYPTENFVFGVKGLFDVHFLTLSGEQEVLYTGGLIPKIAFTGLNKNLFLRAGFMAYPVSSKVREKSGTMESFFTPAVGIGLENVSVGSSKFGVHADYYPGHFAYSDLKAAAEFGASMLFLVNSHEKTRVGVELGVSDVLFVKDGGIENRIKGIFAIGVGNVQK